MNHVRALRSLHLNYTWRGVWSYLTSPDVRIPGAPPLRGPGWLLWLGRPGTVHASQQGIADGVVW